MSQEATPRTAQVLDLDAFRRKRQASKAAARRRQFLWIWPATGHSLAVPFPAVAPVSAARHRIV